MGPLYHYEEIAMRTGFPLTLKAFGEYIRRTKARGARRGDNDQCPLTLALRTVQPKTKGGEKNDIGKYETIPTWAQKFITLYDGDVRNSEGTGYEPPLSAVAAARKVGAIK